MIADLVPSRRPTRALTVAGGQKMRSWFDVKQFNAPPSAQDVEGLLDARARIEKVIREEGEKVEGGRVVIGGFSQCVAFATPTSRVRYEG